MTYIQINGKLPDEVETIDDSLEHDDYDTDEETELTIPEVAGSSGIVGKSH